MTDLHVVVGGHSIDTEAAGAGRRLLGLLHAMPPLLRASERITVLHGPALRPRALGESIAWTAVPWPATPACRRAKCERRALPHLVDALRADVVDLGTFPIARGLPCPAVITVHDLRDLDGFPRRPLPRALVRRILARSLRRATRIVTPSRFTAERLRAHALTQGRPIDVVPGAVEVTRPPAPLLDPPNRCRVLHIGHLEPRKRIDVLIDALAHLPPPWDLTLVGAAPDRRYARTLRQRAARRGVAERVHFVGVVDDAVLVEALRTTDVVALPSAYEGFGLVGLEALAHGIPVVARAGSALSESLAPCGTMVRGDDRQRWAHALRDAARGDSTDARAERVAVARGRGWSDAAALLLESWRSAARARAT